MSFWTIKAGRVLVMRVPAVRPKSSTYTSPLRGRSILLVLWPDRDSRHLLRQGPVAPLPLFVGVVVAILTLEVFPLPAFEPFPQGSVDDRAQGFPFALLGLAQLFHPCLRQADRNLPVPLRAIEERSRYYAGRCIPPIQTSPRKGPQGGKASEPRDRGMVHDAAYFAGAAMGGAS